MSELPVREMTLYKHGVGFFRREGEVKGQDVTLTFRHDAINDVLKSLTVFERGGGMVRGIHYQTPLDPGTVKDSSIQLSDRASLRDLLRDLRGRLVELAVDGETVQGRMIGLDEIEAEERPLKSIPVSLALENDEIAVFRLDDVQRIRLLDDRAAHDLNFFLDSSLSEDLSRSVTVRLGEGTHQLVVQYVAPSPTWRVSYRVVAETSEDDSSAGIALLQGWGLFDNRLDEDLQDVRVTLVAGQPISFIYDLYSSRIPQRPVVEEKARTVPSPVEFRAGKRARPARAMMTAADAGMEPPEAPMMAAPAASGFGREEAAVTPVAEGREAGEFFQYVVTTPVSVKRGESALVPILGADVHYDRELLYNGEKLPGHPVVALRFTNTTGLTLERGPVTVTEDGEYKGEAVIPFTKSDGDVYLPYAVELGVDITENTSQHTEMAGLAIRDGYLLINEYQVRTTLYKIENETGEPKTITIEAPVTPHYELADTAPPHVETATERRWRVEVEAAVEFVRHERRLTSRHEQVQNLTYRRLQRYLQDKWLDRQTFDRLSGLLDTLASIEQARQEKDTLKREREEIYARQAQLRENMSTLKPAGQEGTLRARLLQQLTNSEDRLDAIDAELTDLDQQIAEAEARIESIMDELGGQPA